MDDLLLEIGTEEMPAALMDEAIGQFRSRCMAALEAVRLGNGGIEVYATPRRLVLYVKGLAERQADREEVVRGPSVAAAFGPDGTPTKAAIGFARGQGVDPASLEVLDTPSGKYVFARKLEKGRPAADVLREILPDAISGMEFSRSMRWGDRDLRFIRPIRWIVCLLGSRVINLEVAGVAAGRTTTGHRVLGQGAIEIPSAADYFTLVEERGFVIADHRRRKEEVRRQVEETASRLGGRALVDEDLLDEVSFLVEYPHAFAGGFDTCYLELPREALITPMKHHQRYFPVEGPDGRLMPFFIGVRNGGDHAIEKVIAGNEKVLRARLEDARFFFEDDRSRPLEDFVPSLSGITFQARLGTMLQKVERIRSLSAKLVPAVKAGDPVDEGKLVGWVDRAAYLCKADMATSMVYEFPELQGTMGREYALLSGEDAEVATAIFEHLLPRFAGDELPSGRVGSIVSIADKADTLAGCFLAGIQPTGSQDPFGLRRQALGILHILRHRLPSVAVSGLLQAALEGYRGTEGLELSEDTVLSVMLEFIRGRVRGLLSEDGFNHDVVEAVLAPGFEHPADLWVRATVLSRLVGTEVFEDCVTLARRAGNLATRAFGEEVDTSAIEAEEERGLLEALTQHAKSIESAASAGRYEDYFKRLSRLRPALDTFLDGVMVMVDDERVRQNRLALLARVARLSRLVADLSNFRVCSISGGTSC